MKPRQFRSFAKINLGLEVIGRLPGGYHELRTLFATISLHDTIEITLTKGGVTVVSNHPNVPDDENNLACRAAILMQRIAGRKTGVALKIDKRIAVGGGLGGGSSNAATVLRALDLIWSTRLGPEGLLDAAKTLGADVPYFLYGGPALGLGRGDDIYPLDLRLKERILLVPGPGGVSTASVFRRFGAQGGVLRTASPIKAFLASVESRGGRKGATKPWGTLRNDLQRAALAESPTLSNAAKHVRRIGRAAGASHSLMTGSGSTFFLLFEGVASRQRGAAALKEAGLKSVSCAFVSRSAFERRFESK